MSSDSLSTVIEKIRQRNAGQKYETGLVLSGGAARGFAHTGALKALHEHSMVPDIVAGVSAGSIVGSFYCDGFAPEEIFEIFRKNRIFKFIKLIFNRQGLLNISGLKNVLEKNLRSSKLENLSKPLVITATDIEKGKTRYFCEGNIVEIVTASCSIPVLFNPITIDGVTYADGGVTNNFPIEPLEENCRKLIGVHANPIAPYDPKMGLRHIAINAFHMSIAADIEKKHQQLDYFIEPEKLSKYAYFDFKHAREMFDIGYEKTQQVLEAQKVS